MDLFKALAETPIH